MRLVAHGATARQTTSRHRGWKAALLSSAALLAVLAMLVLGGCMHPPAGDSARIGPFHAPLNVVGEVQLPPTLRRIVLLPVAGGTIATAESVAALNPVFLAALQKENRFEIVALTREELLHRFRTPELRSTATLPHDFMAILQREHAADGVMFIDLTVYKPYRPLVLGVRAKLAVLGDDARLVWTFDNVFSAADPAVANSARHFFLDSDHRDIPADLTPSVLQSPSRFAAFVAAQTFATLPPVHAVAPVNASGAVAKSR